MPYSQPHWLVAFGGTLYTNEIWSCSIRMATDPVLTSGLDAYAATNMAAVASKIQTWWLAASFTSAQAKLTYAKFNAIGTDGKYMSDDAANQTVYGSPLAGTGVAHMPPHVATVATFVTGAARGLASKGRIFLPLLGLSTGASDGLIDVGDDDSIATQTAGLLSSLNTLPVVPQGNVACSVMSKVRSGEAHAITGVKIGRVLDTHRSRRSAIAEQYGLTRVVTA